MFLTYFIIDQDTRKKLEYIDEDSQAGNAAVETSFAQKAESNGRRQEEEWWM